jgi:hypothetical protein
MTRACYLTAFLTLLSTTAISCSCWAQGQGGASTETAGVKWLSSKEATFGNLYHNYYVTQVLRDFGGRPWKRWNRRLRKHLLETQSDEGHEAGSWASPGAGGVMGAGAFNAGVGTNTEHGASRGGRLYCTALCLLALETYYRYPSPAQ